jgi:hypothetical protein
VVPQAVSFYGWDSTDLLIAAWRAAGPAPVGHIVFRRLSAFTVIIQNSTDAGSEL